MSFFLSSDSYIVRVKAVVMTRDDSSGGWLAQDGGALSRVGVCRLLPTELAPVSGFGSSQFLIRGERLRDKQVKPCQNLVYRLKSHSSGYYTLKNSSPFLRIVHFVVFPMKTKIQIFQ